MKTTVLGLFLMAAAAALVSGPLPAHHGITNYDMKKTIVLTGTITEFEWSNPHCLIHLDAMDATGQVRHWTLEMTSTFTMSHKGWNKDSLKRGDLISVETHPARNGAAIGITSGPGFALKVIVNGKESSSP